MRHRLHVTNVVIVLGTLASAVAVLALFPDVPVGVRLLAIAGSTAILIVVSVFVAYVASRERHRVALFAALRGWSLDRNVSVLSARFSVFPFNRGRNGKVINQLSGHHRFFDAFTLTYVVSRPAPQFYQVTYVELGAELPAMELLPEDLPAALAKAVGGEDLKIGNRWFDDTWRIRGDERFVRRLVTPALIKALKRRAPKGMPIAVDGRALLTWRAGPMSVRGLSRSLDALVEVARAIPDDYFAQTEKR